MTVYLQVISCKRGTFRWMMAMCFVAMRSESNTFSASIRPDHRFVLNFPFIFAGKNWLMQSSGFSAFYKEKMIKVLLCLLSHVGIYGRRAMIAGTIRAACIPLEWLQRFLPILS
jgi:hypothetical protein